jgi:hypothetical protein
VRKIGGAHPWSGEWPLAAPASLGGRSLLVTGPLACGKTLMLRSCGERAVAAGLTLLSATCSFAERELAFGVVAQLLRTPAVRVDSLPPMLGGAALASDEAALVRACDELCTALI